MRVVVSVQERMGQSVSHHGLCREVGLELGADDTGVAVRAGDLAPDAAVVGAAALGLGLVDVRHALAGVPRHVLLGVEPLDLHQRSALVLVRLRPATHHTPLAQRLNQSQQGNDYIQPQRTLWVCEEALPHLLNPRMVPLT